MRCRLLQGRRAPLRNGSQLPATVVGEPRRSWAASPKRASLSYLKRICLLLCNWVLSAGFQHEDHRQWSWERGGSAECSMCQFLWWKYSHCGPFQAHSVVTTGSLTPACDVALSREEPSAAAPASGFSRFQGLSGDRQKKAFFKMALDWGPRDQKVVLLGNSDRVRCPRCPCDLFFFFFLAY